MRQAIIYQPLPKSRRIKFSVPFAMKQQRALIKAVDTSFWHPNQKLWSVVNTAKNMALIQPILGSKTLLLSNAKQPARVPVRKLNKAAADALLSLEKAIILKRYSPHTLKTYRGMFIVFLTKFMEYDLMTITKDQIEGFIYELIKKHSYSESAQNQIINAIKFYYEHVLGLPRTFYDIKRPKKNLTIPNVLSENEIFKLINSPKNLKHRAILWTIYSTGIRISEATRLRIEDIQSDQGFVFIKGGKGKKDRKTILSPHLLDLLRKYYKAYKPSYWLFEG